MHPRKIAKAISWLSYPLMMAWIAYVAARVGLRNLCGALLVLELIHLGLLIKGADALALKFTCGELFFAVALSFSFLFPAPDELAMPLPFRAALSLWILSTILLFAAAHICLKASREPRTNE